MVTDEIRWFDRHLPNEETCFRYLLQELPDKPIACPRCGNPIFWLRIPRRVVICQECRTEFSPLAQTCFHRSHLPLKTWLKAVWILCGGGDTYAATQIQRQLGIGSYRTAWRLLHLIREAMHDPFIKPFNGIIEIDEVVKYGRNYDYGKVVVIGILEYPSLAEAAKSKYESARRFDLFMLRNPDEMNFKAFLRRYIDRDALIRVDAHKLYLRSWLAMNRYRIDDTFSGVGEDLQVRKIFTDLNHFLHAKHRGVGEPYLQDYLNEYVFRFNNRNNKRLAFQKVLMNLKKSQEEDRGPFLIPEALLRLFVRSGRKKSLGKRRASG